MKIMRDTPMHKFVIRNQDSTSILIDNGGLYFGLYFLLDLKACRNLVNTVAKVITAYDYSDPDGLVSVSDYILLTKKINDYNYEYFAIKVPKDPSDEEYKILQEIGY